MATGAVDQKTRASSRREPRPKTPQRWWQWILLYPAFAVALITAGPQWIDKGRALALGVKGGSAAEAEKQAQLWRKNLSCSAAPFAWFNTPSTVKVDATICDSGDIFVRASAPDNSNYFKWVPLEDVLRSAGQSGGLIPAAHAATLSASLGRPGRPAPSSMFKLAQGQANIICQKFIDDRHILRRVQTPQGCFDEVIDTFNGSVVSRNPAPCTPQC
jgi:hypothetical protein